MVTALTAKGDELTLTQALLNEEEKRKQSKGKATGGGTDDGESALQHNKVDRNSIKCYGCGEEGHMVRNCPQKKKKQYRRNENQGKNNKSSKHNATPAHGDTDKSDDSGAVFAVGLSVMKEDYWIIDSGASQNMTSNRDLLTNYQEFSEPEPVVLEDGRSVDTLGAGEIRITMLLKEKDERKSTMIKVLYVPKLAVNLFGARATAMKGKVVQFGHTLCWILRTLKESL